MRRAPGKLEGQTYDRDTVATSAAVALEHNVTSLVDSNAVVLVVNRAIKRGGS